MLICFFTIDEILGRAGLKDMTKGVLSVFVDFIRYLNSIHASIKFTHEYSNSSHQTLPFLDVQVHLSNNHIQTDLHTKPTDKHQYLLKTSCHPNHTKQTIPFSLFLRIRRICSTDAFFDKRSEELIKHLVQRGYSRYSLQKNANRVRAIPRHATLQPQEQKATKTDSCWTTCFKL